MAKISLDLKNPQNNGSLIDKNPRAVFLFSDLSGDKASCISNLNARTTAYHGAEFAVDADFNATYENGKFFRGRDYEFTFRLHVDSDQMTDAVDRMYPEVLGEDKACILKAPTSYAAPYEEPTYYFYPADSGDSYLTYGYYVQSKDAGIIFANVNMEKTAGTDIKTQEVNGGTVANDWGSVSTCSVQKNHDAQVRVDGLQKNNQVSVRFVENRYISSYNRGKTITAFTRLFTSTNSVPSATFDITREDGASRAQFNIHFATKAQAKSVAAVVGKFTTAKGSTDVRLSISSVSETEMVAYVQYSDLASVRNGTESIGATLTIYYDTGHEGFQQQFLPYTTERFVCIREAGENNEGQYILPMNESGGSEFENKNLNPNDIIAEGSLFKMTLNQGAGAQNADIAGTLSDKPGMVAVVFNNWKGTSGFQYESTANARARLGGMYDARITKSQLNFTVSVVDEYRGAKGEISDTTTEYFTIGDVVPMVNLHTKTGYSISPGQDQATVEFTITGVQGAQSMYGREDGDVSPYGRVYMLLYYDNSGNHTPVIDETDGYPTRKIKRIAVSLTKDEAGSSAKGDGTYSEVIRDLEPNTSYAIQLVYYASETDFNKDLEYDSEGNATSYRVYLRDALLPGDTPSQKYYNFSTTTTVNIDTQVHVPIVTYSSTGYNNKKVNVSFSLSQGSPSLRPGEQYIFALYRGDDLVLDHREIMQYMTETSSRNVSLDVSPNETLVGRKDGKNVYLNFDSTDQIGYVNNFKLRIIPIRTTDLSNFSILGDSGYDAGDYTCHSDGYKTRYANWLADHSIGIERGDSSKGVYAKFNKLKDLASPFYNIRAYSGEGKVTFRVSIVDADGVIVNDNYMIRAFKREGQNLTPCTNEGNYYYSGVLNTRYAQQIVIDGLTNEQEVVLKVFAVEDLKSKPNADLHEIDYYKANFNTPATVTTDVNAGHYAVKEASEKSTPADVFAHGFIEVIRGAVAGDAYIDFINMSRAGRGEAMRIDMTSPSNVTRRFDEFINPFVENTDMCDVITSQTGDTIYRFTKLDKGIFNESGTYTIAIRIKVGDGNGGTRYDDAMVTYTIA
jgi:hypothetical protein